MPCGGTTMVCLVWLSPVRSLKNYIISGGWNSLWDCGEICRSNLSPHFVPRRGNRLVGTVGRASAAPLPFLCFCTKSRLSLRACRRGGGQRGGEEMGWTNRKRERARERRKSALLRGFSLVALVNRVKFPWLRLHEPGWEDHFSCLLWADGCVCLDLQPHTLSPPLVFRASLLVRDEFFFLNGLASGLIPLVRLSGSATVT